MRNWPKPVALLPPLLIGVVLVATPLASHEGGDAPGLVDFRMAPLEQAKKINSQLQSRNGAGQTKTVMSTSWAEDSDGRHLVFDGVQSPATVAFQLSNGFDSVSWYEPAPWIPRPAGSCDSDEECEDATDSMCEDAGHGGVDGETVTITSHADGSKTCSGDCESNGAVAFVTCNPN